MEVNQVAGKRMTVKQMKKTLKMHGVKTTGTRRALLGRMRKAHLKGGQLGEAVKRASETARGAVGAAGEFGKGVVSTGEALVQAPIKGVKAALNSGGRRVKKGGRHY
jgi:hypothetical protein